jgi:hypothetical protein
MPFRILEVKLRYCGQSNYGLLTLVHALQVVMTPSLMRLVGQRLCLWWGRIMDKGVRRDTDLGHLLVVLLGNASLGV